MAYFKNINLIKVIKIAVGTGLAIFIAGIFGLNYSASAGIITLLSIQDTKKSTIKIAVKRIAAFVLAMLISLSSINDYVPKKLIYKPHKRGFYHALFMSSSILCGCECTNL